MEEISGSICIYFIFIFKIHFQGREVCPLILPVLTPMPITAAAKKKKTEKDAAAGSIKAEVATNGRRVSVTNCYFSMALLRSTESLLQNAKWRTRTVQKTIFPAADEGHNACLPCWQSKVKPPSD